MKIALSEPQLFPVEGSLKEHKMDEFQMSYIYQKGGDESSMGMTTSDKPSQ
jgi:hypothetical protein